MNNKKKKHTNTSTKTWHKLNTEGKERNDKIDLKVTSSPKPI